MGKTRATEREFQGHVIAWIEKQIEQGGLPFERATNDSSLCGLPRAKFPDILLSLDFECQHPFCGWELKTPRTNVRDKALLKDAVEKAQALGAKYFVTWNMQTAIIWRTPGKMKTTVKEKDKVREFGPHPEIESVSNIRDPKKSLVMEDVCVQLVCDLARLHEDENINLPIADTTVFVGLVANAAEQMANTVLRDINKARADKRFDKELNAWAKKQGVNKYDQEYYHTLAQQIAYRIIGKILFYMTLRRRNLDLPKMRLPAKSHKAAMKKMRVLFQRALEVDYQAIFESDVTDRIELSAGTAKVIIELTERLENWSFDLMPLDVVGSVFEKLIPRDARHKLGQYFTQNNLVDLIVTFCVHGGDDFVMDPTCGTGTFLIRSYDRLRYLKRKRHRELLRQIWGFDIAGFPAELATINLCRQDFSDYYNFPRVLSMDFFDVLPAETFGFPPPKKTAKSTERIKEEIPKFDALVGNFPFIRQEIIEKAEKGYKKKLERALFESWAKEYSQLFRDHQIRLSGQADIYAYMFFHAAAHLKEGGRMGFITSNSWLDVAYGYELQRFFLSKFKIVAICESRCEPWFEQSAVNTVFTVLERSNNREANENNLARFVKIKKPLATLFPQDAFIDSQARWIALERFVDKIEGVAATGKTSSTSQCKNFPHIESDCISLPEIISYEDDDVRIRIIRQADLQQQLESTGETVKWGQYLRAPELYFEILERCAEEFVRLGEIAQVRFGIKTGINKFFYLRNEQIGHRGIENRFLKPVIKSPKECPGIKLRCRDLKWRVFSCNKDKSELHGTKALKYINWGESQKTENGRPWPKVESVKGRRNWYGIIDQEPGSILLPMTTGSNLRAIINKDARVDHRLFEVLPTESNFTEGLGMYLNSGIGFLFREVIGRANLGDGALETEGVDWRGLAVPRKQLLIKLSAEAQAKFAKLCKRPIKEIKVEAKRKDRLEFEKAVLRSLGLDEELAPKILEALIGLVEERHLLPKLRSSRKKKRVAQNLGKLRESVSEEVLPDGPMRFPEAFVSGWPRVECREISVPAGKLKLGESFFDRQEICDSEGQHVMEVATEEKAKFIVYAKRKDDFVAKVPEGSIVVDKAVRDYEVYLRQLRQTVYTALMDKCGDHTVSENSTKAIFDGFDLPDI